MSEPAMTEPHAAPGTTTASADVAPAEATAADAAPAQATAAPASAQARLDQRLDQVKQTARKVWTGVRGMGKRARAEARKVTTRGRAEWATLVPRARDVSAKARTRVATAWQEQVTGVRAGLARVTAALGKRG